NVPPPHPTMQKMIDGQKMGENHKTISGMTPNKKTTKEKVQKTREVIITGIQNGMIDLRIRMMMIRIRIGMLIRVHLHSQQDMAKTGQDQEADMLIQRVNPTIQTTDHKQDLPHLSSHKYQDPQYNRGRVKLDNNSGIKCNQLLLQDKARITETHNPVITISITEGIKELELTIRVLEISMGLVDIQILVSTTMNNQTPDPIPGHQNLRTPDPTLSRSFLQDSNPHHQIHHSSNHTNRTRIKEVEDGNLLLPILLLLSNRM
ncbi:MAG: hypothetical protein EZS28_049892, partial [Streblomastix strix]